MTEIPISLPNDMVWLDRDGCTRESEMASILRAYADRIESSDGEGWIVNHVSWPETVSFNTSDGRIDTRVTAERVTIQLRHEPTKTKDEFLESLQKSRVGKHYA